MTEKPETVAVSNFDFWHHHVGISVPDLEASIKWYESVLGFQLERRRQIESIPAEIAILRNGPMHIELFQAPGAAPLPAERRTPDEDNRTHGNKHAAFAVDDVPAFTEELRRRGADIVWVKKFSYGGAACSVRDNAGNLLEFLQAGPAAFRAARKDIACERDPGCQTTNAPVGAGLAARHFRYSHRLLKTKNNPDGVRITYGDWTPQS